ATSEDLGGGLAISTFMDMRLRGRGAATDGTDPGVPDVRGRDASMTLSGGFGSITIGTVEAGNGILGLGGAGAPVYGLDNGTQLTGGSNVDLLQWTSTKFNGFAVKVTHIDALGAQGADNGKANRLIGVTYAAGPLSVAADSTSYGSASATAANNRTRVSASYDLGVAKIGVGNESNDKGTAPDRSERVIGVSVPMGAMTLGLVRASSSVTNTAGSNTGTDVGVKYDFSKSTYVALQYQTTKTAGATASAKKYRVQLSKAF
uniref:porin n=1 Tax=Flavobacterium sp. TaxID=239 RepID=UPI00404728E2